MSLSAEQLRQRGDRVTASFAPYLMAGDERRILSEWRKLVGSPDYEEPDFSDNWAVQFGSWIEPFALDWHAARTGKPLTHRGEVVVHPILPNVACTLDAWREVDNTVLDCKALGGWRKLDEACAFYVPQIVVQRSCVGAAGGGLLIVHGGAEPAEYPLTWDDAYEDLVWERIAWFQRCVEELTPPVDVAPIAAPIPAVREADLSRSNAWVSAAADWLENRLAAKAFNASEKSLKALVEPDVKRAFGHGIECVRDRAGRLSLKELK